MRLSAKEWLIIFVGFIITLFFMIVSFNISFNKIDISSILIIIISLFVISVVVAFVFGIIYKRIGEIDKVLDEQEINQKRLEEKLKIHEILINLEARVIALEKQYGKKS